MRYARWPAEFSKVHRLIRLFECSHAVRDIESDRRGVAFQFGVYYVEILCDGLPNIYV